MGKKIVNLLKATFLSLEAFGAFGCSKATGLSGCLKATEAFGISKATGFSGLFGFLKVTQEFKHKQDLSCCAN